MTIAAGVLLRDGVLLCADTEYTGGQHKFQDSKLDSFAFPGGKIAYALAGHEENARIAVDKLQRELLAANPAHSVRDLIDRVVDRQYRKNVLGHGDSSLDYQLLLAFKGQQNARAELFVTKHCGVRPVHRFSCIGYGGEFAAHILKPQYHALSSDLDKWNFAVYMLALVKQGVPYCGGISVLLILRNDGDVGVSTTDIPDMRAAQIEQFSQVFDWHTHQIYLSLLNPNISEAALSDVVDGFKGRLLKKRGEWNLAQDEWTKDFLEANPHIAPEAAMMAYVAYSMGLPPRNLPLKQEAQSNPRSATVDQSPPPPSQG